MTNKITEEIIKEIKEVAIKTDDLIEEKVMISDFCDWKNVRKAITLTKQKTLAEVEKLISEWFKKRVKCGYSQYYHFSKEDREILKQKLKEMKQ